MRVVSLIVASRTDRLMILFSRSSLNPEMMERQS